MTSANLMRKMGPRMQVQRRPVKNKRSMVSRQQFDQRGHQRRGQRSANGEEGALKCGGRLEIGQREQVGEHARGLPKLGPAPCEG